MIRTYPFTAYVLTPSMGIKKVELVRASLFGAGHVTKRGGSFREDSLYDTPKAAIDAGRAKLKALLADIEKCAANLDKAEGKL